MTKRSWIVALFMMFAFISIASADSKEGEATYKAKCAMCHGQDGKGQTTMGKNLKLKELGSEEVQKQHDSDMKLIIQNGKGKMPAQKGKLTDKQIDDVLLYIRSLKPGAPKADVPAKGAEKKEAAKK